MEKSFRFILVLKYRLLIIFTGYRGTCIVRVKILFTDILIVSHTHSAMVKMVDGNIQGPCKNTQTHTPTASSSSTLTLT